MQRRQSQPNPIMTTAFSTDYPHHQRPLKSPTRSISSSSSTPLSLLALPSTDENRRPSTETSSPSSPAELERELHHMSTRLQQAESRIDRLKVSVDKGMMIYERRGGVRCKWRVKKVLLYMCSRIAIHTAL